MSDLAVLVMSAGLLGLCAFSWIAGFRAGHAAADALHTRATATVLSYDEQRHAELAGDQAHAYHQHTEPEGDDEGPVIRQW